MTGPAGGHKLYPMTRTVPLLLCCAALAAAFPAQVIEDFDDGAVTLGSFPGQDVHPDSWALDSIITYNNSPWSLRLFGNTWKTESIAPIALDSAGVWQVAALQLGLNGTVWSRRRALSEQV